jgi:hypothetical protein
VIAATVVRAACSITLTDDCRTCHVLERSLALALKTAAEAHGGLRLQAYEHHGGTASVHTILSQLPVQHLQDLHLCFQDCVGRAAVQRCVRPLAALTSLSELAVRRYVKYQTVLSALQQQQMHLETGICACIARFIAARAYHCVHLSMRYLPGASGGASADPDKLLLVLQQHRKHVTFCLPLPRSTCHGPASLLLPALRGLPCLRYLSIGDLTSNEQLSQLPTFLESLQVSVNSFCSVSAGVIPSLPRVNLGYLSQCTSLTGELE